MVDGRNIIFNRSGVFDLQSNKEDHVRETLERRVKIAGLEELISRVLVPTEKVTEIKGGKKRVTQRKLYPGYVMVEMALTTYMVVMVLLVMLVGR